MSNIAAVGAAALIGAGALGFAGHRGVVAVGGLIGLVVLGLIVSRGVTKGLCLAFTVSVLVPIDYLEGAKLGVFNPALLLVAGVALSRLRHLRLKVLDTAFIALVIASALGDPKLSSAIGWTFALIAGWVLPSTFAPGSWDVPALLNRWVNLASGLAVFALIERFVLLSNPLFGNVYASAPVPVTQIWATYRATTTLGHPLLNGTFFATATAIAVAQWMGGYRRHGLKLAALCGLGVIASGSRSSLVSAAVAVVLVLFVTRTPGVSAGRRLRLGMLTSFAGVVVLSSGLVRSGEETASSSQIHRSVLENSRSILEIARPFGDGPGLTVSHLKVLGTDSLLESYWLEAAISLGVLAMVVMMLKTLMAAGSAIRLSNAPAFAGLAALTINITVFKPFTGHPFITLWMGLLIAAARMPYLSPGTDGSTEAAEESALERVAVR